MSGERPSVLVLGASGFIGARIAARVASRAYRVRAGARNLTDARRRFPQLPWVRVDFASLTTAPAWGPILEGVDVVINCVGVLQDAAGDSSRIAHVEGPKALIEACASAQVRRLIHISAVGTDEAADTAYARDKQATEAMLAASGLDWIVVRPSLVVAREVYGGTALVRGLAGLPGVIPLVGGGRTFRPVHIDDLSTIVAGQLEPGEQARRAIEVAGPQTISLSGFVTAYRAWLGFPPARTIEAPRWAVWPVLKLGDLVGWLGWISSMRTTSLRQLDHDAAGQGPPTPGVRPFCEALAADPAGVQDRWHARLFFVRPVAVITLGLYWLLSGLIALGPAQAAATAVLRRAGFGAWSGPGAVWGALLDVVLGLLLFIRRFTRSAALAMCAATVGYLAVATLRLAPLWLDPLGPWLKVFPMMALCLFVAATDDRR